MDDTSLLSLDASERERMLDMVRRLRPAKRWSMMLLVVAAVVSIPVYGWAMLVPLLLAAAVLGVSRPRADRVRRPEYLLEATWLFAQLAIVAGIALSHGPRVYLVSLLVLPMLVTAAVLPGRIVALGTAITALLMLAAGVMLMPSAVAAMPPVVTHPIALLVVLSLLASRTAAADKESRHSVVVDPLTGLLNRSALQARASELTHHLGGSGGSEVAVLLCDVDHFKRVNDERGHAAGDAVLAGVARRLKGSIGRGGSVYRYGGEEFIVLLEGSAATGAAELAEQIGEAVRQDRVAGLPITVSLGVASSSPTVRDYAALLAIADRALYRAKAAGRDCVRVAEPQDYGLTPATAPVGSAPLDDRRRAPACAADTGTSAAARRNQGSHDVAKRGGWLVFTNDEREHMLDIVARATEINKIANPVAAVALIFSAFWLGWLQLVPLVVGITAAVINGEVVVPRSRRPERPGLGGPLILLLSIGVAMLVVGHQILFALPLIAILMFPQAAASPARTAVCVALIDAAVMTAVALLIGGHEVVDNPSILVFPLALLGAIAFFGHAIGKSTMHHRGVAAIDPLTGALTRRALRSRAAELEHRDDAAGEPVSILIVDLDHFKAVNDEHGHTTGDRVLVDVVARIREGVRAFDSVYRIGGEEFLLLLVGLDAPTALDRAERIRAAVGGRSLAGLELTVSVGVATCPSGVAFDYEDLFASADSALLSAKASGRNRVLTVPPATQIAAAA
jgi:diguanylate cyclase (GGDEF)-like protein